MCGLFGVVRSPFADDPGRASDVFVALGALAEERGSDAAGVALVGGWPGLGGRPGHDGCRVVKGRGPFSAVWRSELLAELDRAPVAMGHTRRAVHDPLRPGSLVPGSSEAAACPVFAGLGPGSAGLVGTSDGEAMFGLLAGHRDPSRVTAVLEALAGRSALAWVERDRPTQVHLARAARAPLAVAVDSEQNIYWASDPRWFRVAQRHTRARFATVVMLHEGTYLRVGTERAPGRRDRPRILDAAAFAPATHPTAPSRRPGHPAEVA